MPKIPTISVVIPCFNSSVTVVRAVESVLAQTLTPIEIILVDDSSTDCTLEIIQHIQHSNPTRAIRLVRTPINSGPGTARNLGISTSTGDLVAFLDADDWWHSRKLEISVSVIREDSSITFIGHKRQAANFHINELLEENHLSYEKHTITVRQLLISNCFATSTVVIKRSAFDRLKFATREYAEDYLLWLELLELDYKGVYFAFHGAFCLPEGSSGVTFSGNLLLHELREIATLDRFCKMYKKPSLKFIVLTWSILKYFRRVFRRGI